MARPRIYEQTRGTPKSPSLADRLREEEHRKAVELWIRNESLARQEANRFQAAQQGAPPPPPDHWERLRREVTAIAQWRAGEQRAREEQAQRARLEGISRLASARAADTRERSQQLRKAQAMRTIAPGINAAYRAVARARFGAAAVTEKNKPDNSILGRVGRAAGSVPGLGPAVSSVLPAALRAADTPRRAVVAGAMEIGDAVEKVAGREDRDTAFGRARVRDTGFSWEDFKRNTLDDDKNIGFGDVYQEGLNRTGADDTALGNTWVKRTVGFAGDLATDPLTYVPLGVARSGLSKPTLKAGERAFAKNADVIPEAVRRSQARIARDTMLTGTRRGRALEAEVRRVAAATTDAGEAMRRMPGLAPTTAREIAAAPTKDVAQEIASRALRTGEYVPDVSLRRQALVAATGRGLRAPGGLGLGRRVIRESEGLLDVGGRVRRLANNAPGAVAVTRTTSTAQARRATVKASLLSAGIRSGDARELVAETSTGLTPWDRVNQALVDIEDAPGIVADIVESTFESILPKAKDPVSFNRAMSELANDADAMDALLEAETLIATARGDFGEDAAKQVLTELGVGFTRPGEVDALQVIKRAGNRAGLTLPKPSFKGVNEVSLKAVTEQIENVSQETLKAELRGALAKVPKGKKGAVALNRIAHVAALAADDAVAADAAGMLGRYGSTLADRASLVGGARRGLGQRINPARKLGKVLTSVNETIAPGQLRFLSTENAELALQERVKAFDAYLGALGVDDTTRAWGRQMVADVQAEADLYRVVENTLSALADAEGVPADILADLLRKTQGEARDMGFKAGADGELVNEVQNLSQLTETVALPDPVDVKRTVRELAKAMDDPAKLAEIRKYLTEGSDTRKIARAFAWLHRTWKLMVVTNLYMPVVGGFVGFAGTDGDLEDRLKGGFQWAALGALAPSRYVIRIGIEETARRVLLRGFVPTEFIPGIAKWRASRGVDRPLMSAHLLSSGDPTGTWMRNQLATRSTGEFAAMALPDQDGVFAKLGRRHPRYVDSWWRIVNYEINEANGALDRMLLGHRAGYLSRKQVDDWFKVFLDSDEGKLWWRRWKGAHGAPRNPAEAFARQYKFIEDYVPADIARVRLPAMDADFQQVPRSLLKGSVKRGDAPAFIHAEKTWSLPRARTWFRDIGAIKDQLTDTLIFGGPTRTMQRRPLTRAIYKDEYTSMVSAGVEPKLAQQLADRNAVNLTNEVMFNQNNESRFASKVDIVFPFQQPREELIRVWAPLVFNNKIRTIQLTNLGARLLENGVSSGTFYEYTNPYTGETEWRAKIPGSASLSRALGGVNAQFDFGLRDIFFLAQDNMGSTLGIPSPGGPFYSVVTRSFIDAFPEQYGNLPDAVKKYLFPFGASGELVRNEPNRLWMGFMGTPPPWEFASEFEQRNEYNKVSIHMFLHLRYEHWKETGEWKDPSQAEVEQATKAFFQTQALIGAVWPAPSRYVQPWQELVEAAKVDFIDPKTGEFDYFGFVNEHPNMAPFMTSRGEYVGPNDFKHWSRSDEERAEDAIKRWERTRSLKDFRAELNENRLTAQAWEERNLIPFKHADWEMDEAYIRWEERWLKKHPEVVEQSRNNYFRDRDLSRILRMADSPTKDRAVDSWRKRYDVSFQSYKFHVERLRKEGWEVNYWRYSRPTDTVTAEVRSIIRSRGISEDAAVSGLQPAEQYKYWRAQQAELVFYDGVDEPQAILDRYYLYNGRISDLYRKYPKLSGGGEGKAGRIEKQLDRWRGDVRSQIDAIYREIDVVSARFNELKAKKQEWSAEGQALYQKRSALYDMVKALKDKQFQELPGILEYYDDMAAVTALMRDGKPTRQSRLAYQAMMSRPIGYGGFIPSNEELAVLNMPKEVREAYTQGLINQLNLPAVKGQKGKLYWEWLTDFQKDWLSKNLPDEMVREWKDQDPDNAAPRAGGAGGGGRGGEENVELAWAYEMFRKYSKRPEGAEPPPAYQQYLALPNDKAARREFLDRHPEVKAWLNSGPMANMPDHIKQAVTDIMVKHGKWEDRGISYVGGGGAANPELAFAYEMFKQYSKRAEGAKAPAAYAEYLKLPANPAVRNQFLDKHPEVAQWIALGPMANMPEHLRFMVQNIMVKHGKWEGEVVPDAAINDLAFAREQLRRWNLRGQQRRPDAYDAWLQMPSGVEKAQFLKDHPEIEEWLKLGPMANMPDAYREVVRDIMVRYGEWSTDTDGLGKVISDYYATPAYARDQYLEDHPELVAYWAAIQTPEERRMAAMVDQFFSIQDPNSRRAYLIVHPELKDHFVQRRTERYERFLTHVAIYMGSHPEMFERYLERQEDVLNDLLLRYAEPPLLREIKAMRDVQTSERRRRRAG